MVLKYRQYNASKYSIKRFEEILLETLSKTAVRTMVSWVKLFGNGVLIELHVLRGSGPAKRVSLWMYVITLTCKWLMIVFGKVYLLLDQSQNDHRQRQCSTIPIFFRVHKKIAYFIQTKYLSKKGSTKDKLWIENSQIRYQNRNHCLLNEIFFYRMNIFFTVGSDEIDHISDLFDLLT